MGYRQRNSDPDERPQSAKDKESNKELLVDEPMTMSSSRPSDLRIDIPPPPSKPYTLAHNATPGWDTPWSSRAPRSSTRATHPYHSADEHPDNDGHDDEKLSTWDARRKRFRAYILYNAYVPLVRSTPYANLTVSDFAIIRSAFSPAKHCAYYGCSCHGHPNTLGGKTS